MATTLSRGRWVKSMSVAQHGMGARNVGHKTRGDHAEELQCIEIARKISLSRRKDFQAYFFSIFVHLIRFVIFLNWYMTTLKWCHNVPETGRNRADIARIGPIPARFWHILAYLEIWNPVNHMGGIQVDIRRNDNVIITSKRRRTVAFDVIMT